MFGFLFKKKDKDSSKNTSSSSSLNTTGSSDSSSKASNVVCPPGPRGSSNVPSKHSPSAPVSASPLRPTSSINSQSATSSLPPSSVSSSFPRTQAIKASSSTCSVPHASSSSSSSTNINPSVVVKNESVSLCDLSSSSANLKHVNSTTNDANSRNSCTSNSKSEIISPNPTTKIHRPKEEDSDSLSAKNRNSSGTLTLKEKFLAQSLPRKLSDDDDEVFVAPSPTLANSSQPTNENESFGPANCTKIIPISDKMQTQVGRKYYWANDEAMRDLSDAERKAIGELDDLRAKLLAKDTEISLLHADINMLSADRDNKIVQLDELSAQLRKLREENDSSLATIRSIESELEDLHLKNTQLVEQLLKKSEYLNSLDLEKTRIEKAANDDKIKTLEIQIKSLEKEKNDLEEEHEAIEVEREEELRAMQNALDDALEQKIKLKTKYEHDFQSLKTACSAQEQQLMDDFEWKLRQVEQSWKKKLTDKERQSEDKLSNIRSQIEREIAGEREKIKEDRIQVEQQMRQICHLKSHEVEVVQLRGLTHEQQRALRSAARQIEHLKFSEKVCHDELCTVRTLLDKQKAHLSAVDAKHQRRLEAQEESIQAKLDKLRNELNSKWEDRMRDECSRLKQDLTKLHIEEKHLAVESMKLQKQQEIVSARQVWERQRKDLLHEISRLKDTITEKESACHRELEKITTQADRETWELRRILDKTSNNHADQIMQMQETHTEEIESLQKSYDELMEKLKEVQQALKDTEEKLKQKSQDDSIYLSIHDSIDGTKGNQVNKSDSGCGDETTTESDGEDDAGASEEECSDEDEEEGTRPHNSNGAVEMKVEHMGDDDEEEEDEVAVSHLREEVANLQGSIEKLTSTLNTNTTVTANSSSPRPQSCSSISVSDANSETSSEVTETDEEEEEEDDESDDEDGEPQE